jgi:hypothetical protein
VANAFSKEEQVAFEDVLQGFEDGLVLSRNVNVYNTPDEEMERTQDTIWRPVPYIATSIDGPAGTDISSDFEDVVQLSVPASIGFAKTVPWTMNAKELRDALQADRFGEAAKQRLASDVNVALMNAVTAQGTLVVTKASAAAGFADVAALETIMNEQGIEQADRFLALSTSDYNAMAADLAGRGTLAPPKTLNAYEEAFVGRVASFDTFKLDYANNLPAETSTTVTINGANQRYVPIALETTTVGQVNHDNREQVITISVTSGTVQVGDCITIAGVYAVHHITKVSTGNLKTFRITEIVTGAGGSGTVKISPPIISADSSPTDAELAYKNVSTVPADGAAITFINIAAARMNPFWHKNAIEILPGRYSIPADAGAAVIRGATDQGIELSLTKQWDINTNKLKYRMDCLFGVAVVNPEMAGITIFNQT